MRLGFLGRGDAMTEVTNRGPAAAATARGHGAGNHPGLTPASCLSSV